EVTRIDEDRSGVGLAGDVEVAGHHVDAADALPVRGRLGHEVAVQVGGGDDVENGVAGARGCRGKGEGDHEDEGREQVLHGYSWFEAGGFYREAHISEI